MTRTLPLLALLAAATTPGRPGQAHAFLDHAVPAVGSTVASAPTRIELFFTQDLEPAFSGATIADAGGRAVSAAAATVDPANKAELVLSVPTLPPGHYKVSWHAVAVDTHRTEGSFGFDIRR